MKKFALILPLALVAGAAFAQEPPAADTTQPVEKVAAKAEEKAAPNTHEVTAEIAAVDAMKNTVTIKAESGDEKVVPVEGKATAELKDLKPGEKVTLICKDDEKGAHKAVVGFKKPAISPEKK
jgi:uncharacterized protein YdeI (BOF family)